ncbi:hypothetical protein BGW36DRAFT_349845 [Talaromyces proteolyticus]|uniref:Lipocalin-like domain-containing protein n=1 Tax=Talaromyces proteolyticus TaxID=1131652 RepID=A0AAD4PS42_9EURO|nr:uncharacterized protein BGW36DRAFT_349845 [Talaromyces proteolyticus]KAH8690442.1 hypothetical protein BGW36DRAFT_349845 [Talaromyces proteolyticus]
MAAPKDITIENLNGKWTLDKSLSSPTDPLLALQGINWVVRKAVGMSNVILGIKEYAEVDESTGEPVIRFEISQNTTSGLPGTTESRWVDGNERKQEDHIFGKTAVSMNWINESKNVKGKIFPVVDSKTILVYDDNIPKFLAGEVNDDNSPSDGFLVERPQKDVGKEGDGLWLQLFIRNLDGKWTAEQTWGFENIAETRRYVRRVVVSNSKGEYRVARLVYAFEG